MKMVLSPLRFAAAPLVKPALKSVQLADLQQVLRRVVSFFAVCYHSSMACNGDHRLERSE